MTVLAFCSLKSDGVTTAVLTLAHLWPRSRRVAVVDCDPSGGDIADRLGLQEDRGLRPLAVRLRDTDPAAALRLELVAAGGVDALLAPASGRVTSAALGRVSDALVPALRSIDGDALVDCGRIFPDSPALPVLREADRLLLVTSATGWAQNRVNADARVLLGDDAPVELLLVGQPEPLGPGHRYHDRKEVETDGSFPVVGALADDGRGARRIGSRPWWFTRSPLAQTAAEVVDALCEHRLPAGCEATP